MASGPSWLKVATGFRLVAQAAANQISSQSGKVAIRASEHGIDFISNVKVASMAISQDIASTKQENVSSPTHESPSTTDNSFSSIGVNSDIGTSSTENLIKQKDENKTLQNSTNSTTSTMPPSETKSMKTNTNDKSTTDNITKTNVLPEQPLNRLQEGSPVPATRLSRALSFASLGLKLTLGTATEATSRFLSPSQSKKTSIVANNKNADILASSLCRMRGAALKIGQMLSIQDESVLPPALTRALEQVRAGADAMPQYQLKSQLDSQLNQNGVTDWESHYFQQFDWTPIAAASIGQVHKATLKSGKEVAMKVQYPGVANSIESDLNNMSMLISMFGFTPKGLFMDKILKVGREELLVECDYNLERQNQERFRQLLLSDDGLQAAKFVVPTVIPELCTEQILTTEFAPGGNIDKVSQLPQEERNRIARTIMRLTLLELFSWRFMQTDPNWGNFIYDVGSGTTYCIDFGAAREYSQEFVQLYCQMIWAAANKDEEQLMQYSHKLGFFTGNENDVMLHAHRDSGFTIGEPFQSHEEYDFGNSQITKRIAEKSTPFLQHRLTAPPQEVYSLHRKIAGSYWLCIKLGAKIKCRDLLEEMVKLHS